MGAPGPLSYDRAAGPVVRYRGQPSLERDNLDPSFTRQTMGTTWNTRTQTKQQFVHELIMSFSGRTLVLAHSVRGNNLWVLLKPQDKDPLIGLFKMSSERGCWGYKDMAEADGPFYYDCPLTYLDRAPEPNGFNLNHRDSGRTWRDFVRDHHSRRHK